MCNSQIINIKIFFSSSGKWLPQLLLLKNYYDMVSYNLKFVGYQYGKDWINLNY